MTACGAPAARTAPASSSAVPAARVSPAVEESAAQAAAPAARPEPPSLPELLRRIEAAYRGGNYTLGLSLVKTAFELKDNDVSALDRIGSIYYVLGRYGEALTIWSKALPLEKDDQRRQELENSIKVARRELGLADEAFVVAASSRPAAVAATAPPAPKKPAPKATAAELDALYKKGVRYYASGEYLQATTVFLRLLELDPGNAEAAKALKRLKLDQ